MLREGCAFCFWVSPSEEMHAVGLAVYRYLASNPEVRGHHESSMHIAVRPVVIVP